MINFHIKTLNEAKALKDALASFDSSKNTVWKCYIAIIIETVKEKI